VVCTVPTRTRRFLDLQERVAIRNDPGLPIVLITATGGSPDDCFRQRTTRYGEALLQGLSVTTFPGRPRHRPTDALPRRPRRHSSCRWAHLREFARALWTP
jgi:hypothetical protein